MTRRLCAVLLLAASAAQATPVTTQLSGTYACPLCRSPQGFASPEPLRGFYTLEGSEVTDAHLTIAGFSSGFNRGSLYNGHLEVDLNPETSPVLTQKLVAFTLDRDELMLIVHNTQASDYYLKVPITRSLPEAPPWALLLLPLLWLKRRLI